MLKLKPPTHAIDGLALFVSSTDPAWDIPRIEAEREAFVRQVVDAAQAKVTVASNDPPITAAERAAAVARSPVERYYAGKTRYQLDAPDWGADGKPTTARAWLKPGEKPAEFGIRRLGFRAFQEVLEIENSRARLIEACRLGLRSIVADGYKWKAIDDAPAGDEQLEALHEASPALVIEIGGAVLALSRPLDSEAETPR